MAPVLACPAEPLQHNLPHVGELLGIEGGIGQRCTAGWGVGGAFEVGRGPRDDAGRRAGGRTGLAAAAAATPGWSPDICWPVGPQGSALVASSARISDSDFRRRTWRPLELASLRKAFPAALAACAFARADIVTIRGVGGRLQILLEYRAAVP
jgi:hypothetical protein